MSEMTIGDIVNRVKNDQNAEFALPAETALRKLHFTDIPENAQYFRAVDQTGNYVGTGSARRLRHALKLREQIGLTAILDELHDAVVAIDMNGIVFYVNESYHRVLGAPAGAVLGRSMFEIEPGATLLKTLHTGKAITKSNVFVDSVQRYVEVNAFPLYDSAGMCGAASVFRDMTEVKHLSQELERTSQVAAEYNRQIKTQQFLKGSSIIGENRNFLSSVAKATTVAATDVTVLLRGESGVGKEVFARLLHQNSERRSKPFIAVNCAAVPDSLIESELFGYEEGAFTGAKRGGQLGKFQLAEGGTLFLDEIGDMPQPMQAKLLRVLQEGEIEKVGRQRSVRVDVRLIAGTNQPLEQMIEDGRFRQDLFYRLNVVPIVIPPLRERGRDIVLLAAHYLEQYNNRYRKNVHLSEESYQTLLRYDWPGNIRELQNILESCVVLCSRNTILPEDFPEYIRGHHPEKDISLAESVLPNTPLPSRLDEGVALCEKLLIQNALQQNHYDRQAAADSLGISRRTFYRKIQQYGISLK